MDATTLLAQRIAEHAYDHQHVPDEQLPALYARVREGLGPIPDDTLDALFAQYHDAKSAQDEAHLHARSAPWGSPSLDARADTASAAFDTAVRCAL